MLSMVQARIDTFDPASSVAVPSRPVWVKLSSFIQSLAGSCENLNSRSLMPSSDEASCENGNRIANDFVMQTSECRF